MLIMLMYVCNLLSACLLVCFSASMIEKDRKINR